MTKYVETHKGTGHTYLALKCSSIVRNVEFCVAVYIAETLRCRLEMLDTHTELLILRNGLS